MEDDEEEVMDATPIVESEHEDEDEDEDVFATLGVAGPSVASRLLRTRRYSCSVHGR